MAGGGRSETHAVPISTTAIAAMRTVGVVGRRTEKGRTATVDDQDARVRTRWSLNGQEQPYREVIDSNGMDAPTRNGIDVPKWKCQATT
jgi:hypothetical protein